jgi:hypothetical protein
MKLLSLPLGREGRKGRKMEAIPEKKTATTTKKKKKKNKRQKNSENSSGRVRCKAAAAPTREHPPTWCTPTFRSRPSALSL